MPLALLNIGTNPNDNTGSNLRAGGAIINAAIAAINNLPQQTAQNANLVLCGPASGAAALAAFRALVALDLGSGTGVTTKFLRGDLTWQTVSGGGGAWGSITGTLSAQTDLQTALTTAAITSGVINGAIIGGVTPEDGTFTEVFSPQINAGDLGLTLVGQGGALIIQAGVVRSQSDGDLNLGSAGNRFDNAYLAGFVQLSNTTFGAVSSGAAQIACVSGAMQIANAGESSGLNVTRTVGIASVGFSSTNIGAGATVLFSVTITGSVQTDAITVTFDSPPGSYGGGGVGGVIKSWVQYTGSSWDVYFTNTDPINAFTLSGNFYVSALR
jgi:hypothetical protein